MKKFKKLIPALCMLLISAVLMGTSTYAWFSMNNEVTANGMQVVAKSDSTYLLISKEKTTADEIQTENAITTDLAVTETEAKLLPCAPARNETETGYLTTAGKTTTGATITTAGVKVTDKNTAAAVTNWYTANAAASSASGINAATARQLASFEGFVIQKTVYLTVAKGANQANNLKVNATITQKAGGTDVTAARILVTTSDGGFAILNTANSTDVDIKGTNTHLTDDTVLTVNIYIYYDGNDSTVFTNNAANLKGANIELKFSVDPVNA